MEFWSQWRLRRSPKEVQRSSKLISISTHVSMESILPSVRAFSLIDIPTCYFFFIYMLWWLYFYDKHEVVFNLTDLKYYQVNEHTLSAFTHDVKRLIFYWDNTYYFTYCNSAPTQSFIIPSIVHYMYWLIHYFHPVYLDYYV
jgi:hypothetical protein